MLKAVIFDMDGVLVDTEPLHARAAVLTMKNFQVDITTEYCYRFIGSTTIHMLNTIIEEYNLPFTEEQLYVSYTENLHRLVKEEGYISIPYVEDLIKDLYKKGIKLAIASSSTMNQIEAVTKHLKIKKFFDKLVSGTNVPNPKPAPDIFLETAKKLGIDKDECLIIEDSMNGTLAAAAAGISCIGFINENSGKQDLSKASVLIESFENIDATYLEQSLYRAHGIPITIGRTRRLIIRELSVKDITDMYTIYQNEEVRQYVDDIDEYLEIEIDKHKAYIKNVYGFYGYGLWGIFSKYDDKLIGRCGIQNREINGKNEIELGYLLDVAHWGFGYAIECAGAVLDYAFERLGLSRVVAVIDKLNTRSIKVAEHIGMKPESEIKDKNRDCYLYFITNESIAKRKEDAAKTIFYEKQLNPDSNVYSKHYDKPKIQPK